MNARNLMNSACTIRRPASSNQTATGFPLQTYSDSATGVACSVQAASSNESRAMGRATGETIVWVYLPLGTDVGSRDRIIATAGQAATDYSGKIIALIGPAQNEAGRGSHFRIPGEVLDGGGLD